MLLLHWSGINATGQLQAANVMPPTGLGGGRRDVGIALPPPPQQPVGYGSEFGLASPMRIVLRGVFPTLVEIRQRDDVTSAAATD